MKTYTLEHPELGRVTYRDRKRYLWLLSVAFPMMPLASMALYARVENAWVLWWPILFLYGVVPLLDYLVGEDESNPPEALVPQLEADAYYRILTYLTVPLHFVALIAGAWFVASHELGLLGFLGLTLTVGVVSGLGINTGHELGHKSSRLERNLAKLVLAVPAYGHFAIEHNAGHHTDVATPEDSASSRFGESIYKFARREIPGGIRRGFRLEAKRLARLGKPALSRHNEILQSYAVTALLYAGLITAFGWIMLPFLLIQGLFAWWQLTSANYIEHYGLLRAKRANGRYERCRPEHSWNANHVFSNVVLFHLERHSDHHAHAARRYQSLRNFTNVPQLPSGYFGMFLLAYFPRLWRRVMDPRLMQVVGGDVSRINLDPDLPEAVIRRLGSGPETLRAA